MKFNCKTDFQAHCLPETYRQVLEDEGHAR